MCQNSLVHVPDEHNPLRGPHRDVLPVRAEGGPGVVAPDGEPVRPEGGDGPGRGGAGVEHLQPVVPGAGEDAGAGLGQVHGGHLAGEDNLAGGLEGAEEEEGFKI